MLPHLVHFKVMIIATITVYTIFIFRLIRIYAHLHHIICTHYYANDCFFSFCFVLFIYTHLRYVSCRYYFHLAAVTFCSSYEINLVLLVWLPFGCICAAVFYIKQSSRCLWAIIKNIPVSQFRVICNLK